MIHQDLGKEESKDGSAQLNPCQGLTTPFVNGRNVLRAVEGWVDSPALVDNPALPLLGPSESSMQAQGELWGCAGFGVGAQNLSQPMAHLRRSRNGQPQGQPWEKGDGKYPLLLKTSRLGEKCASNAAPEAASASESQSVFCSSCFLKERHKGAA